MRCEVGTGVAKLVHSCSGQRLSHRRNKAMYLHDRSYGADNSLACGRTYREREDALTGRGARVHEGQGAARGCTKVSIRPVNTEAT